MHHKGIYSTGLNLCVYQSKYLYMLTVRDRAVTPRLGCRLTGVGGEDGGEKNTVQEMMAFLEKSIVIYFAGGISPKPQTSTAVEKEWLVKYMTRRMCVCVSQVSPSHTPAGKCEHSLTRSHSTS